MEAWARAATPGDFHANLEDLVGQWDLKVRWRMQPEAEWMESQSKAESKWILGGRFIVEHVQGESMGMPFEGFGHTGYDNVKKKYVSTWMDSMGTGMMMSEGTCDPSGKVFTFSGTFMDPMTGKSKTVKSVLQIINKEKHVFEMFDTGPDGKEFLSMEITYTRG